MDKQFEKAKHLEREQLLKPKTKTKNIKFPLVVDYNPRLPDISAIIKKHSHLLESNQEIKEIFKKFKRHLSTFNIQKKPKQGTSPQVLIST